MGDIKRVLWIDDYPNNEASSMFISCETKKVSTMDEAITEISSDHLYDYDTIVLDIDFENGLPNGEKNVLRKLSEKIYLSKDQKNKSFIINNGGYLLFLYLLEKGYPSEQVAFLTGNAGIIGQLKAYTNQNISQMSKDDIVEAFKKAWIESEDDFLDGISIDILPIDKKYKDSDFLMDCAEKLDSEDYDGLKELIDKVTPSMVTGNIQNTGDMMIFRFHEANLESPMYFSKNDNDIEGHNCSDAGNWLKDRRTSDKLTRWLLLDVADYIEQLFRNDMSSMNAQVGSIFDSVNNDPGIRSSFRQMYFVFDGLRNTQRRGIYYQAVSAMLIPFDSNPKSSESSVDITNLKYDRVQKMFARFSKQARNYCAHNYFGSSVSNETVLYLIMGTVSAVLTKKQRQDKDNWYQNAKQVFCFNNPNYVLADNVNKIDQLLEKLLANSSIDIYGVPVEKKTYSKYTTWELLRALGYNTTMNLASEQSTTVRENYFIFTLAAYVVKWFAGSSEKDVEKQFGEGIRIVFEISNQIVANYVYPHTI